jgi:glucosylceramidase
VPIASCDFSTEVYSYAPKSNDYDLTSFSIAIDSTNVTGNKLGFIKEVLDITETPLSLFASIWAPPAWMTDTGKVTGNPHLRDEVVVKKSYVNYFRKFFEAYKENGIDFWGVTAQNEPAGNTGGWQSLVFTAE